MPSHVIDLSSFIPQNTLVFSNVPNKKGEIVGDWEVPPFDEETEYAFWAWQQTTFRQKELEQKSAALVATAKEKKELSAHEEKIVAHVWAPLIALAVKNVTLDVETLRHDYHGQLLRTVGGAVVSFFLTGEIPESLKEQAPNPS